MEHVCTQEPRSAAYGSGTLEAVILAAEAVCRGHPDDLSDWPGAYRGALTWGITVKIEENTDIDADELLTLIDATSSGEGLDLTDCNLRHLDLSRSFIERRWADSPFVSSRRPPAWRSSETGGIDLARVCLKGVSFWESQLQGADLQNADLRGAHLSDTQLQDASMMSANLSSARLLEANLQDAQLFGTDWRGASLLKPRFEGASFVDARLEGVDFYSLGPGALARVRWSNAFLDRTRIRSELLGGSVFEEIEAHTSERVIQRPGSDGPEVIRFPSKDRAFFYSQAREVYLLLKNNFNSIGRYRDASWAYQKEREMERKQLGRGWHDRDAKSWLNVWRWLTNWFACVATGYGERPERTVMTAGAVIFGFALAHYQLKIVDPNFGRGVVAVGSLCFWDALVFSAATFFTAGFGTMEPMDRLGRAMTVAESGLGIGLFALLIFTLGNRISRA